MINEDIIQALNDNKKDILRDLRVASQAYVVAVHRTQVDVQLTVCDVVGGVRVTPPVVKNLRVVGTGSTMPKVGDVGIVLHLDRRNQVVGSDLQESGGPAHEIGYGVFLPLIS